VTARLEVFEGEVLQFAQVADFVQPVVDLLADLPIAARTDLQLAEIWMTHRQVLAQKPDAMTMWALRIAER
jgi:hypothetical protein